MSDASAFEQALTANPDDGTGWRAFADFLVEQDDPRGEFMQVQLSLENEELPKEEREKLKARETELLKAHEREWLGALSPILLDPEVSGESDDAWVGYGWRRGFLGTLDAKNMTMALAQTLTTEPAAKFLAELRIRGKVLLERDWTSANRVPRVPKPSNMDAHCGGLFELIGSPCLANLRVFRTGSQDDEPPEDGWCDCHCCLPGLEHLIESMSRVEELHLLCNEYDLGVVFLLPNLTRLRVLRAYHFQARRGYLHPDSDDVYPLEILASNPAFENLTHLQFHPHGYNAESFLPLTQVRHLLTSPHLKSLTHLQLRLSDMGDEGVREFIASGILKRLKWLDLRHGCITDEGAKLFAECPDTKNLERLDLTRNGVTSEGLNRLRNAKVNAVANQPLTQQELEDREYLNEGDFE